MFWCFLILVAICSALIRMAVLSLSLKAILALAVVMGLWVLLIHRN
jgi:hypothetical protein